MLIFPKPKTIEDIALKQKSFIKDKSIIELRKAVKIVIIDDNEFAPLTNLKNNDFDVTLKDDISSIQEIENFDIILCDIEGVGLALNKESQGAHVLKLINQNYPYKIPVAYTANTRGNNFAKAEEYSYKSLRKDSHTDDWIDLLDTCIQQLINPVFAWKRARERLYQMDVTPYHVMLLEDAYVSALEGNLEQFGQSIEKVSNKIDLKSDARSIVNSLIASTIFKVLENINA